MPNQSPNPLQKLVRKAIRDFINQGIDKVSEKPSQKKSKTQKKSKSRKSQKSVSRSGSPKPDRSRYIPASVRVSILHRDHYKCTFCGRDSKTVPLEVDHIIPFSKGGGNEPTNLQTLCLDCNRGKGSRRLQ